jgi:hypothetical protein
MKNPFVLMAVAAALMAQTPFERGAKIARRKIKLKRGTGIRYKPNGDRERGNSVCPPVAAAILNALFAQEAEAVA